MNNDLKFEDLKIGDAFFYKEKLFIKKKNNIAFNASLGFFTIHPTEQVEKVEPAEETKEGYRNE